MVGTTLTPDTCPAKRCGGPYDSVAASPGAPENTRPLVHQLKNVLQPWVAFTRSSKYQAMIRKSFAERLVTPTNLATSMGVLAPTPSPSQKSLPSSLSNRNWAFEPVATGPED
jgi:hypothetical protein